MTFQKHRKPAYQLTIDFGDLGIKKTSAQITALYSKDDLLGKQIVANVNFEEKQIANFMSQCLVLEPLILKKSSYYLQKNRCLMERQIR